MLNKTISAGMESVDCLGIKNKNIIKLVVNPLLEMGMPLDMLRALNQIKPIEERVTSSYLANKTTMNNFLDRQVPYSMAEPGAVIGMLGGIINICSDNAQSHFGLSLIGAVLGLFIGGGAFWLLGLTGTYIYSFTRSTYHNLNETVNYYINYRKESLIQSRKNQSLNNYLSKIVNNIADNSHSKLNEGFIKYITLNIFPSLPDSFVNSIIMRDLAEAERKSLIKELYPEDIAEAFFKKTIKEKDEAELFLGSLSIESVKKLKKKLLHEEYVLGLKKVKIPFTYTKTIDLLHEIGEYGLLELGKSQLDKEEWEKVGIWYGGGVCDEEWQLRSSATVEWATPDKYGYKKREKLEELFNSLIQYDREAISKMGFTIDRTDYVNHSRRETM